MKDFSLDQNGRVDIEIYNDANAFLICSKNLTGKKPADIDPEARGKKWKKSIEDGIFLPISLDSDDGFNLRVVKGQLSKNEETLWIGKLSWTLNISDGKLMVIGGTEYLEGEAIDDYLHQITLPKGQYQIHLYTYITAPNSFTWVQEGLQKPFEDWEEPDLDENKTYIDFVLQLKPLKKAKAIKKARWVEEFLGESEWRKPTKNPEALESKSLVSEAKPQAKQTIQTLNIHDLVKDKTLSALDQPCVCALDKLWCIYALAFFENDSIGCEILLTHQSKDAIDLQALTYEEAGLHKDNDGVRIGFPETGGRWTLLGWLKDMKTQFSKIPEGTTIEMALGHKGDKSGLHRYRGNVKNKQVQLSEAYPQIKADQLQGKLQLMEQMDGHTFLEANSEEELKELQRRFSKDFLLSDINITYDGLKIYPEDPEDNIELVAEKIMKLRYR